MNPSFLCHQHWNSHDNQIRSSQHVNPSYSYWDLLYLKSLEFYLKPLNITVLVSISAAQNLIIVFKEMGLTWPGFQETFEAETMVFLRNLRLKPFQCFLNKIRSVFIQQCGADTSVVFYNGLTLFIFTIIFCCFFGTPTYGV